MVASRPLQTCLVYLQSSLRAVYNDRDETESKDLRQLSSYMLRSGTGATRKLDRTEGVSGKCAAVSANLDDFA